MNKIVITGDFLRTDKRGILSQASNIEWFYNLIRWQVGSVIENVNIELIIPDKEENLIKFIYDKLNLNVSEESWIKIYDLKDIPSTVTEYVLNRFSDCFVIGYELPPVLMNIFDKHGIKYIDHAIHPVRYLDDIFLGARTNCQEVFSVLCRHALPEELFFIFAGIHRATMSRLPKIHLENDSCLFIGQTDVDRSLIRRGCLLTLENFKEKIDDLGEIYSTIYYKPHPYTTNLSIVDDFFCKNKKVKIIDGNVYNLIVSTEIKKLYTISSSVFTESNYFGKECDAFYAKPLIDFKYSAEFPEISSYVPLYNSFLHPNYWASVLSCKFSCKRAHDFEIPNKTSRLRTSLGCYWGYNYLDANILHTNIVSELDKLKCKNINDEKKSYLRKIFK